MGSNDEKPLSQQIKYPPNMEGLKYWHWDDDFQAKLEALEAQINRISQLGYVENSDIFEKDVSLEPTDYMIIGKAEMENLHKDLVVAKDNWDSWEHYCKLQMERADKLDGVIEELDKRADVTESALREAQMKSTAYELQLIDALELANKWITTHPDPESDGLSDAPVSVLTTIQHGRELKKLIKLSRAVSCTKRM